MKTKTAVLNGKPDAGNPHVRFDEGEVASAKPRRGSLLYGLNPGQAAEVKVRVFNPSAKPLCAGRVTLRLPAGWFYDRETVDVPALSAYGASAELVFRIRTPDRCAATRFRPINFIYENADVKSMPTAEVVWWKDAD